MVPICGEWTRFFDPQDEIEHYRAWGLIPPKSKKLRPIMVVDGYFGAPEPCKVVGYQGDYAVIELADGFHAIHGEYLAELQPAAQQRLPSGVCFAEILESYIVLDIETTGFDFQRDRITEIAAFAYEYGRKVAEYHSLVNPCIQIPPEVVSLTGISQADVQNAPSLKEIAGGFLDFIGDKPIVGHNIVSFDVPFLSCRLSAPIPNTLIDTLPMARSVFPLLPRHKLDYLDSILHLGSAGSHRAAHDVETTNALLWACLAPRRYESAVNRAFLDHRMKYGDHQERGCPAVSKASLGRSDGKSKFKKFEKVDLKSITPSDANKQPSGPLCGKAIVFTGELTIPREEAMQIAVDAGAILRNSVSAKTAYLVVGKQDKSLVGDNGMSTKEEKAHELNKAGKAQIHIVSESEFLKLVKREGATV